MHMHTCRATPLRHTPAELRCMLRKEASQGGTCSTQVIACTRLAESASWRPPAPLCRHPHECCRVCK